MTWMQTDFFCCSGQVTTSLCFSFISVERNDASFHSKSGEYMHTEVTEG